MIILYSFFIQLYAWAIRITGLFSQKAKLLAKGQNSSFAILSENISDKNRYIWVHAASLGEFEQGRPIIEAIKKEQPEYKIVLTFFSPSGYEIRKNYSMADVICYLPMDKKSNAKKFIKLIKPEKAIFIKYEFWANYLLTLKKNNIPTYIVSAIFREKQLFFKSYAGWYRNLLTCFSHIFVQDKHSKELLDKFNIKNVTVSGDTRFDRVTNIASNSKELPLIESFKGGNQVIVAGSSWEPDEKLLFEYFNNNDVKLIIAPHETQPERIKSILRKTNKNVALYSEQDKQKFESADCLIIDCIGILSSIYKYADIAYIGGGFGVGIHNVLEAAVYGTPVIFGPNYARFKEANDLVNRQGGFSIQNCEELTVLLNRFLTEKNFLEKKKKKASVYIKENVGATELFMRNIF